MKIFILLIIILSLSCHKQKAALPSRTFRMGFGNSAPRFDSLNLFIRSLNIWTQRADAAIISAEVPWKALLAGQSAQDYVMDNYKELAQFYRSKNLMLWVYIDPQNGLDRSADAIELKDAGKSIADDAMQKIYTRFTIVMDSILHPEHIGLALETNLIRFASPPAIYNGVKQGVNDAAKELKLRNTKAKLSVSIQADMAWGKLTGTSYQGIATDFIDFPFIEELGISSYPYLVYDKPADLPQNYYSKLIEGKSIPVFVSEGGWSSQSVTTPSRIFVSSDEIQKEYIVKQEQLLNAVNAKAVFQLTFTDIDLTKLPPDVPPIISYFANLGLVDINFNAKPSLGAWDNIFKKTLK